MKKRISAFLLSLALIFSIFPIISLAASDEGEGGGEPPVTCSVCGLDECVCTSEVCPDCGQTECVCPPEVCPTCGEEECVCPPEVCPDCGEAECDSQHENWCDICEKDNCGEDHSLMPADDDGEGGEPTPTFYDELMAAQALYQLYELMTNEGNSDKIGALTIDELKAVKTKAEELYTNDYDHSASDDYEKKYVCGKIDNLIVKKDDDYLTEFLAKCNCGTVKGVHKEECPAYIPLPEASVTELALTSVPVIGDEEKKSLTYAMRFATRKDYTELQKAYYGDWIADFVISTNLDIESQYACLGGHYEAYNEAVGEEKDRWVYINGSDMGGTLPANTPLRLIYSITDWTFPFEGIIEFIPSFECGIWVDPEYIAKNPGFAVKVELRLYPTDESGNYDEAEFYSISSISYQSTSATINYVAGANGSVDNESETVGTLTQPAGATPIANEGYHFAGWYYDAGYTQPVDSTELVDAESGKLTPKTNSDGIYVSASYYAKFEPDAVELKFVLSGGKSGSTYLFTLSGTAANGESVSLKLAVKGGESVTVKDLPVGSYTVTADNKWNWRETVTVSLSGDLTKENASVTVSSAASGRNQWFNGYADAKK